MAEVEQMEIRVPLTKITAIVTRELERSFTEQELAEVGGLAAAKGHVLLEAAKYGTIVDSEVDAEIVA